jgi:DNA excision repair protein ERCC-3
MLAHVKIGLTATPLREDENIKSLIYLIGPQLYVGSWKKFVEQGFLANPKCLEIRTSMTQIFRQLYEDTSMKKGKSRVLSKEILYEANPNKVKALMFLLSYHESLNDQIIVFCDKVKLITFLASSLKRPLLGGDTSNEDRNFVFDMFRQGKFKTIFLTRIGDEAIDLPNANVAIEIAMNKGSRRQMMQRLGRIMRPK